jgi:hypothetical protein
MATLGSSSGWCNRCGVRIHADTLHTCCTLLAPPTPAEATVADVLAELQRLSTALDRVFDNLAERVRELERRAYGDPHDD